MQVMSCLNVDWEREKEKRESENKEKNEKKTEKKSNGGVACLQKDSVPRIGES